jgi:hypothetical protein
MKARLPAASWFGTVAIEMTPGESGKQWRALKSLAYISARTGPGKGQIIEVLPGMPTDGASIPRLFWRLIGCPLRGRYVSAALIHDGLYLSHATTRQVADDLFREMLLCLGLPVWKSWLMYQAVRIGGRSAWSAHTKTAAAAGRYINLEEPLYISLETPQ